MQTQKRTRSSGPVELIIPSVPEETSQTERPAKLHFDNKSKNQKKQKKQISEQDKSKKPIKQFKESNEKSHKRHRQSESQVDTAKSRKNYQSKKEQTSKDGIASMTKQKQQKMKDLHMRLNSIKEKTKIQQSKIEQQKSADTINNNSEPAAEEQLDKKAKENEVLVDLCFPRVKEVKVYIDSNNFAYSVTFNHTDVSKNVNKFYIIQILQELAHQDQFLVFTRWGRVGLNGHSAIAGPSTLEIALELYRSKVQQKYQHKYVKIQTTVENSRRNYYFPRKEKKSAQVESKLDLRVQSLIRQIFDMKMMKNQLNDIGLDSQKMPLGKISQTNIVKGYEALKEIMEEMRGKKRKQVLTQWCNKFYSQIPHSFGMKNISNFLLDTESKVRAKLEMLQSLQDIHVFTKMLSDTQVNPQLNQLDANYLKLDYEIKPLEKETSVYSTIMKYVENTHAPSHNLYKLEVEGVYELNAKTQLKFEESLGNHQLLWHGSRLTNFVGILSHGLRIAPPEAPATGYMFGKGVYFADIVSKSANYCYASKNNPFGCLLLCEVALGNCNEKFYADNYANLLPQGLHSVKGVGKMASKDGQKLGDVYVPNGTLTETGISNTSLHYNEYVVYDVHQIRCRFLLRVKFVFK